MSDPLSVEPATPVDRSSIESLLAAADLPRADVEEGLDSFVIGSRRGEHVCVGAVKMYDGAGLLRSVAVDEQVRGEGLGTELCDRLEDRARSQGVETVYLLTTTATAFFRDRGYTVVERSIAPRPIQQTTQFAKLCPASATCLRKRL